MGQIANQAFSSLILALSDDDAQVRATVAYALGQIGVSDRTAVLALVKSLSDVDWRVRRNAADALAEIGVPSGPNRKARGRFPFNPSLER